MYHCIEGSRGEYSLRYNHFFIAEFDISGVDFLFYETVVNSICYIITMCIGVYYNGVCLLATRVLSRKWLLICEVANKGT